jgi:hypothetical protein
LLLLSISSILRGGVVVCMEVAKLKVASRYSLMAEVAEAPRKVCLLCRKSLSLRSFFDMSLDPLPASLAEIHKPSVCQTFEKVEWT